MKLSSIAETILHDRYYRPGDTAETFFSRVARAFSDNEQMAERIYEYIEKRWFMPATPVLTNAPERLKFSSKFESNFSPYLFKKHGKGLPISCFLSYVPDTVEGLVGHTVESRFLSIAGGGIGAHWSDVRGAGGKAPGVIPFLHTHNADVTAYHQGDVRRGAYAAFLHVSHPDIVEFVSIRKPTGGDANRKCLNLHHGVVIPNSFMYMLEEVEHDAIYDDTWPLICPHTGAQRGTVRARDLWRAIVETRAETGEPYIVFEEAANRDLPESARRLGYKVRGSNLCCEITLPTGPDYTAVCCLSSLNIETFDEWKEDSTFIADVVRFLDNVLEYFIHNAGEPYRKAVRSAQTERSIGLGAMGLHAYLQQRGLSIESPMAVTINKRIFTHIRLAARVASEALAMERGPALFTPERRNAHLLAVAPNASTALLVGTSPGIEPWRANVFVQKTDSGAFLVVNPAAEAAVRAAASRLGRSDAWAEHELQRIAAAGGSVQDADYLTKTEREVLKTASEVEQGYLIDLAADRQRYIDQAQSLNLFIEPGADVRYLHALHMRAWRKGLKTLYYLRSGAVRRAETMATDRTRRKIIEGAECLSCEG